MTEVKKTVTALFMVPTLKIGKERLIDNGYLNAFSKDAIKEKEYNDCIFVLFRPKDVEKFREFLEEEYERTKSIIEDYDHTKGFVVIVYKLDKEFKGDFDLIRKGKYSKTSRAFQQLFPEKTQITIGSVKKDMLSFQTMVFRKDKIVRDKWEAKLDVVLDEMYELHEGYHDENEILTDEILNKYTE